MKLILANPRGFCAGVNMAIAVVDELSGAASRMRRSASTTRSSTTDTSWTASERRAIIFVESIEETP